jgi:hypothetical protein
VKINGYAYVTDDISSDISPKGSKKPIYERIRHGALAVAPNLFVNCHHIDAISVFAFAYDGSLKAQWGRHGLRFEAALPDTFAGRDVLKALTDGLRLGVSVEFTDAQHEVVDGVHELVAGTLTGISLTRPKMAYYSKPAVLLADGDANTLPPDVQALRNHWLSDIAPRAQRKLPVNSHDDDSKFANWFKTIKRLGTTLAQLAKEGFRDDVIAKAKEAGLK